MKKSVAALAILAASGAALAQSNVTLYGRVDAGVTKQNSGTSAFPGGGAADRWELREGSGSRLGLRGTEDLGGGLKAGFVIEHRFSPDTGAANATFWNGRSYVELAGAMGAVYLGREYAPAEVVAKAGDPFAWETVGQMGRAITWAGYSSTSGERHNNVLGWRSPKWGGFSAQAAVSAAEGAQSGGAAVGRAIGVNAQYKAGALYLGLGYDQRNSVLDNDLLVLAAAYELGAVRLLGSYAAASVNGADNKAVTLGLSAPLAGGVVKAVVGRLDPDSTGRELTKIGLGYDYALSKRTTLYAGVGSADEDTRTRTTAYNLGVKHNF